MSEIIYTKDVITRKEHLCFGCGRPFPKNTKMQFNTVVDNGIFNTYICRTCEKLISKMPSGDEFCFGELHDEAIKSEVISNEVN